MDTLTTENMHLEMSVNHPQRNTDCVLCGWRIAKTGTKCQIHSNILSHMTSHSGPLFSKLKCSHCFDWFTNGYGWLQHRLKWNLDENSTNEEEKPTFKFRDYTEKVNDCLPRMAQGKPFWAVPNPYIPTSSLFSGFDYQGRVEYMFSAARKECSNYLMSVAPLFRFGDLQERHCKYIWSCGLCSKDKNEYSQTRFSNDISLRLFVIHHMKEEHSENEDVMLAVDGEIDILKDEIQLDVYTHFIAKRKRIIHKGRSSWFYVDECLDSALSCAIAKRIPTFKEPDSSICLVCFNPIINLSYAFHHIGRHHSLNANTNKTEFRFVEQLTKGSDVTLNNFPLDILQYSTMFRVLGKECPESMLMFTWRCVIPCRGSGHCDDILEFPSLALLRLYALRHFVYFHPSLFKETFMDREWSLLANDSKLSIDIKQYDHSESFKDRHHDVGNPNDFISPILKRLLPSVLFYADFKVCAFCYWTGFDYQFLEHIVSHGYIPSGRDMFSNGIFKKNIRISGKYTFLKQSETAEVPPSHLKILGSFGRRIRGHLNSGQSLNTILDDESTTASDFIELEHEREYAHVEPDMESEQLQHVEMSNVSSILCKSVPVEIKPTIQNQIAGTSSVVKSSKIHLAEVAALFTPNSDSKEYFHFKTEDQVNDVATDVVFLPVSKQARPRSRISSDASSLIRSQSKRVAKKSPDILIIDDLDIESAIRWPDEISGNGAQHAKKEITSDSDRLPAPMPIHYSTPKKSMSLVDTLRVEWGSIKDELAHRGTSLTGKLQIAEHDKLTERASVHLSRKRHGEPDMGVAKHPKIHDSYSESATDTTSTRATDQTVPIPNTPMRITDWLLTSLSAQRVTPSRPSDLLVMQNNLPSMVGSTLPHSTLMSAMNALAQPSPAKASSSTGSFTNLEAVMKTLSQPSPTSRRQLTSVTRRSISIIKDVTALKEPRNVHARPSHKKEPLRYECQFCPRIFTNLSNLHAHENGRMHRLCRFCKKESKSAADNKNHEESCPRNQESHQIESLKLTTRRS